MTNIILEAISGGVVLGMIIGLVIGLRKKPKEILRFAQNDRNNTQNDKNTQNDAGKSSQEIEKEKNVAKLKEFIASIGETPLDSSTLNRTRITNDKIEKMLGISNATAERYLNELEKAGLLKQVGKTGVKTYYEKV